jgi:Mg2+ and Co2+ transporter CorA
MDEHKRLEALLASLVELIKKDEKKLESHLKEMRGVANRIGGKVLEEYLKLEEKVLKFSNNILEKQEVIEECLRLQNELWEL